MLGHSDFYNLTNILLVFNLNIAYAPLIWRQIEVERANKSRIDFGERPDDNGKTFDYYQR